MSNKPLLLLDCRASLFAPAYRPFVTWFSDFCDRLSKISGLELNDTAREYISNLHYDIENGLQKNSDSSDFHNFCSSLLETSSNINNSKKTTDTILNQISINTPWKYLEDEKKLKDIEFQVPYFYDYLFNEKDLSSLLDENNVYLIVDNSTGSTQEYHILKFIVHERFNGTLNLVYFTVGQSSNELLKSDCGFKKEDFNENTRVVSSNPDRFINHVLITFNPDGEAFNLSRNFFHCGSYLQDADKRKALTNSIDNYGISKYHEMGSLRELNDKFKFLNHLNQDFENRSKEVISIAWNFRPKKFQWCFDEKDLIRDLWPICFTYYDSASERPFREHDFCLHRYASLHNCREKDVFEEWCAKTGIAGDKSVFFIDDLAYAQQTNDRDYFIKTMTKQLIDTDDFKKDLSQWAKDNNILDEVKIVVPTTHEFRKEDFPKILEKIEEVGIRLPVILKSGLANDHEMYIVKDQSVLQEVIEKMPQEYSVIVQELVPHDAIEYKVYTFSGSLFCLPRFSVPNLDSFDWKFRQFGKENKFEEPEDFQETLDKAPNPISLWRLQVDYIGNKFGFYCYGIDILRDNRDGSYHLIDFNAMPGYQKFQLAEAFRSFIQSHSKK